MTADEYATALALASTLVIAAVHRGADAGPYITAALSIEPAEEVIASGSRAYTLIALLAGQVDPNTSLTERLAWTEPSVLRAAGRAA